MKSKIVYQDGDYAKVVRGFCTFEDEFVKVVDDDGLEILIGKKFIISIREVEK